MDTNLLSPESIAQKCSRKHIQFVIEDLVHIIKMQEHLAERVMMLNPNCNSIGYGMLRSLQSLADQIIERAHHSVR